MMRISPKVTLIAGATELRSWQSYEIESDIFTPADAFSFVAPNPDGELAGVISKEDDVAIEINDELVMVGNVDDVVYDVDDGGSVVRITGRDRGRFLVDCSSPVVSLHGQTLKSLAERIAGAWIPTWLVQDGVALPHVKKMKVDPGESPLDVLTRFAEQAKVIIWVDEEGRGVIGRPDYSQPEDFSLYRFGGKSPYRKNNNVLRGTVTESSRDQFSQVTVLSQCSSRGLFSSGASKIKSYAREPSIHNKPRVVTGQATSAAQAKTLAERQVQRAAFDAWKAEYTVAGHENSGKLWRTNTLCMLVDELAGVSAGSYFVSRRRFYVNDQGCFTDIELHPSGVYLG